MWMDVFCIFKIVYLANIFVHRKSVFYTSVAYNIKYRPVKRIPVTLYGHQRSIAYCINDAKSLSIKHSLLYR